MAKGKGLKQPKDRTGEPVRNGPAYATKVDNMVKLGPIQGKGGGGNKQAERAGR